MRSKRSITLSLAVLLIAGALFALPAWGETLYAGIDSWVTKGDGSTFTDFSREPIPAGFLCAGSKAFTGRIVWRGVPIVMDEMVTAVDTLVERLDDATFNRLGSAATRLKLRALSLESVSPVRTDCGSFNVRVNLTGNQPATRMQIFRENENGGRYLAPLALSIKLSFSPVGSLSSRALELTRKVRLGADPRAVWSFNQEAKAARPSRTLRIDSDGDGIPDTVIPRSSNFAAGRLASLDKRPCPTEPYCHESSESIHCVDSCYCPNEIGLYTPCP